MSQAKNGDTVKVHYTGKLQSGEIFDSSRSRRPLEFTIGGGKIIPGIEEAVVGMQVGDTRTIEIPPEGGFGPRREELVVDVKRSEFPGNANLSVGQRVQMRQMDGDPIELVIKAVNTEVVTLDANHPLAGRTLFFDIELMEIA